jgi:hypothetical protein
MDATSNPNGIPSISPGLRVRELPWIKEFLHRGKVHPPEPHSGMSVLPEFENRARPDGDFGCGAPN